MEDGWQYLYDIMAVPDLLVRNILFLGLRLWVREEGYLGLG
jgi:hypothetical protein